MLAADLQANPSVILLDRKHLGQLSAERDLARARLKLAHSTLLLERGLRHSPDKHDWVITVHLKSLNSDQPDRMTLTVEAGNLRQTRESMATALFDRFKLSRSDAPPASSEEEARIFSEQSALLCAHGERDAAARAAEAAFALCPCPDHRKQTARIWAILSVHGGAWPHAKPPAVHKILLKASLHSLELHDAAIAEHIAAWRRGAGPALPLPLGDYYTRAFRVLHVPFDSKEEEIASLRAGIQSSGLRAFRRCRQHYLSVWDRRPPTRGYGNYRDPHYRWMRFNHKWISQLPLLTDDVHAWAALMREVVETLDGPKGNPVTTRGHFNAQHARVDVLNHIYNSGLPSALPTKFVTPEEQSVVTDLYDSLAKAGDRDLALACLVAKMNYNSRVQRKRDHTGAAAALDRFLKDSQTSPHLFSSKATERFPLDAFREAFGCLVTFEERDRIARRIFDPLIDGRDADALRKWRITIDYLLGSANEHNQEAGFQWLERLLPVLHDRPPLNAAERVALRAQLDGVNLCHALNISKFYEVNSAWDAYEITRLANPRLEVMPTRLPRDLNTGNPNVYASLVDHEQLLLVWALNGLLWATAVPVDGGPETLLGRTKFKFDLNNPVGARRIRGLAGDASTLYVATWSGLLMIRDGSILTPQTDPKLPSVNIASLALLDGKLFLGLYDGGLMEFDPATGRSTTLASSRSLEARHALDGGGVYTVIALAADAERRCV